MTTYEARKLKLGDRVWRPAIISNTLPRDYGRVTRVTDLEVSITWIIDDDLKSTLPIGSPKHFNDLHKG